MVLLMKEMKVIMVIMMIMNMKSKLQEMFRRNLEEDSPLNSILAHLDTKKELHWILDQCNLRADHQPNTGTVLTQ